MIEAKTIIKISHLDTQLGGNQIHKDVNLEIQKGEIFAIVGGSGSGKTTLLRQMLGLSPITSGKIEVFGQDLKEINVDQLLNIQKRWGVLFQQNALFSSLSLIENIGFPLKELTDLDPTTVDDLALLKIMMVGLSAKDANKYISELSGGMQKRAGIARAIAMDPELLFLDEPTSGLDPQTAAQFDDLILNLQQTMGLTIVMVTHDLDSLWKIADRVALLGDGSILCVDTMKNLVKNPHPLIRSFFTGERGRAVRKRYEG